MNGKLLKARELLMNDANRIGITLRDWAAKGDWRLFFLHRDRLAQWTVDRRHAEAGAADQSSETKIEVPVKTPRKIGESPATKSAEEKTAAPTAKPK